jgi:glutaredoxin 3
VTRESRGAKCKWCEKARALLVLHDKEFVEIDATNLFDGATKMVLAMGLNTVPQVFVGPHHIGGFEDLKRLLTGDA